MITLYDLNSKLTGITWSANVAKVRLILNYKGLEFQTKWLEYPDIEPTVKAFGGKPVDSRSDGTPRYTLPAIVDHANNDHFVVDSLIIAKYLDKQYPHTPLVVPKGSEAAVQLLEERFQHIMHPVFVQVCRPLVSIMYPPSAEFFCRKWFPGVDWKTFGSEELSEERLANEKAERDEACEGLEKLAAIYDKNGDGSLFLFGETLTFADCITIGSLTWIKLMMGEDSDEWTALAQCGGGKWGKQVKGAEKWLLADNYKM